MAWIEENFFIPETRNDPELNGRLHLMPYQRDALREALSKDEYGNYKYSIIIWSDIKKSIKSTIAAAVNLYRAMHTEWGEFYIIANDLKQADSRVAHYIRRAIQLNPEFEKIMGMRGYRTSMPNGTYIEAIPIDPSGEAGSNADQITFCLDEQTEVMTLEGFKGWDNISSDDWVATRNPETGEFQWQKPKGIYCQPYKGKMIRSTHRSYDALITPDHRIYGRFVGGRGIAPGHNLSYTRNFVDTLENRFLPASEAAKTMGFFPVTTSKWTGGLDYDFIIPETIAMPSGKVIQPARTISARDYAEFMGWYLSEGCAIKKRGNIEGFAIGQSRTANPEKRKRIIDLLKRMGFTPREWAGGMNIVVYHSSFGKYLAQFGLSDEKYVPLEIKNMTVDMLKLFLDTFIDGDGCRNFVNGVTISSRSAAMRDDFVEIAQKCGYSVSTHESMDTRWKKNPIMYAVYLRSQDTDRKITKVEKRQWIEEQYDGMVFCPSTDNGVIYVRRNGTYYWTGNSELWGANEEQKQTMWAESTLSPTKHGKSFRWIESYAGFTDESKLLYSLYETGVKRGRLLWPDRLYDVTAGAPTPLELYVNDEARMLCLWNTQPRNPWQTPEYYASEAAVLLPNQFARMHRNQWVTSEETFVPAEWYNACFHGSADWPAVLKNHPMIIALDAATSRDNFGLWMGCRHPDKPDEVMTIYCQRWKPPQGGKIDFKLPEVVIRKLVEDYNVIEIAYDPYQLHAFSMQLKQEGLAWFRPFSQGGDRAIADSQLYSLIRDRRFWHRGEPDLQEHIMNANAKLDDAGSKMRIVKRTENMKIDLAVCASMGSYELLRLNLA